MRAKEGGTCRALLLGSEKALLADTWRMMSRHDSSDKIISQLDIHLSIFCFARLGLELWKQQFSSAFWLPAIFCQWGTGRKLESRRGNSIWAYLCTCCYCQGLPRQTPSPWQQDLFEISSWGFFGFPRSSFIETHKRYHEQPESAPLQGAPSLDSPHPPLVHQHLSSEAWVHGIPPTNYWVLWAQLKPLPFVLLKKMLTLATICYTTQHRFIPFILNSFCWNTY